MTRLPIVLMLWLIYTFIYSQQFTISGTLSDSGSGENLVSANVYEFSTLTGTVSNYYGFYSLKLPYGAHTIVFSYVGYETKMIKLDLTADTVLNVKLEQDLTIEEVTVTDKGPDATVRSSQMSMIEIPLKQTKQLPVMFGEVDIIKTIQLLPGVQSGTEGLSGLYVRGGGPSENLILLDGVPVYNVSHLFGFFSVFNDDAVQNFSLYKGGFPARYGGRLSSVLDIKMKEGNMKEFKGTGSIGLIASKATVEGPIIKDKSSFIVSLRRTYIDALTWPIQKIVSKTQGEDFDVLAGYFFHDLNAKANYKFSDKSRLYLSVYAGKDKAYSKFKDKYGGGSNYYEDNSNMEFWWGNITSALRWNYILSNRMFCNVTGTFSRYRMEISDEFTYLEKYDDGSGPETDKSYYYFAYYSGIEDISAKADFDFIPGPNHYIRFGTNYTHHLFRPGVSVQRAEEDFLEQPIDTTYGNKNIPAHETAVYIEDEIKIGKQLKANIGARASMFNVKSSTYYSLEPRISARFLLTDKLSIKGAYSYMQQYVHLLANSSMSLPTDLWMPVTDSIKPMSSWQVAGGFALNLNHGFQLTGEYYYKQLKRVIEYKEGATYFDFEGGWEGNIESGRGTSKGFEILLQRLEGKTLGWIGYTLAWADREFQNISFGKPFPFKYDRRHDFTIAVTHNFSKRFNLGATWVYGSGYPFTFGDQMFTSVLPMLFKDNVPPWEDYSENAFLEYNETRNNYRLPDYHRLDVAFNFTREKKRGTRTVSWGVYNAYSRNNAFYVFKDYEYYWNRNGDPLPPQKKLKQISFFPVMPYFRYTIKF